MTLIALNALCPGQHAEALSDALMDGGALSVEIRDAGVGSGNEQPIFGEPGEIQDRLWESAEVSALFEAGADIREALRNAAQAAGLPEEPPYTVTEVADQDWVRLTQSQFEPIPISQRLWITPTWHTPPDPDAINIVLDPGLAFGTGSHPTTRLCLRWLDENMKKGNTVLDYGCGSGILAIAALKLGAARAVGIDIDPQAVAASRDNALRNQVKAEFYRPDETPAFEADIVVANILTNPLKVLAPLLARATKIGGRIALSGVLSSQAEEVRSVYRSWYQMETYAEEEGWVCLAGTRLG